MPARSINDEVFVCARATGSYSYTLISVKQNALF